MKSTLLSWLAKYGSLKEDRKILGGHVSSDDVSVFTYSRDALAGPLKRQDEMLQMVRSGA